MIAECRFWTVPLSNRKFRNPEIDNRKSEIALVAGDFHGRQLF